mgnify:CR=1 FL=1
MPDVRIVQAQLSGSDVDDPGRVTFGYYVVEDGMLTMTEPSGDPVRHPVTQELFRAEVDEMSERKTAARLAREVRRALRGDTAEHERFGRRIKYPEMGQV